MCFKIPLFNLHGTSFHLTSFRVHKINKMLCKETRGQPIIQTIALQTGVHFVLRGKTQVISNWSDFFRSRMLRSCQFPVRVPCFAQVSTTFVVIQLQISRVTVGRMVSIVSKHERIPEWMCFSEKADQALVVYFTDN